MIVTPLVLADLLAECNTCGIRLALADGGGLEIDAPQDTLTPELLDRLKVHKAGVLAILSGNPAGKPRPTIHTGACSHDAGAVMRPTVQGERPFCSRCGRRIGFDAPYPWA